MDAETVTLQQEREQLQKEIAHKHQEYKEQIEELQGEHDDLLARLKRATKVRVRLCTVQTVLVQAVTSHMI